LSFLALWSSARSWSHSDASRNLSGCSPDIGRNSDRGMGREGCVEGWLGTRSATLGLGQSRALGVVVKLPRTRHSVPHLELS
jgi:hypothetical protein